MIGCFCISQWFFAEDQFDLNPRKFALADGYFLAGQIFALSLID